MWIFLLSFSFLLFAIDIYVCAKYEEMKCGEVRCR